MRAALQRLLDPTDPNHDSRERFIDACDSVVHAHAQSHVEPVAQPVAPVEPVAQPVAQPVAHVEPVAPPVAHPVTPPVVPPDAAPLTQSVAQPDTGPVAQPGAHAGTASALRSISSMLPPYGTTSRAAAHGTAMFAAARRVFNVSDHNPEGRFADLCDSLSHPESYLPGETPTPAHATVVNPPQERRAQRRTQVSVLRSQVQQRTGAATRSRVRRDNERLRDAKEVDASDEDSS